MPQYPVSGVRPEDLPESGGLLDMIQQAARGGASGGSQLRQSQIGDMFTPGGATALSTQTILSLLGRVLESRVPGARPIAGLLGTLVKNPEVTLPVRAAYATTRAGIVGLTSSLADML